MRDLEIRALGPGDREAAVALHNRAFGPPRWDEAWWTWRFERLGPRSAVLGAFDADGGCHAIYGGVRHRFLLDGDPCLVLNHSDVAVAPELRHGLGGSRLLLALARRFFEEQAEAETPLMYGVPEPALRRVVVRHLRSEVLGDLTFLGRELGPAAAPDPAVEVSAVESFGPETNRLWATCAPELGTAIVRDAAYLNTRYRDHPAVTYRLLEARDASSHDLRGLAILRRGGWNPEAAMLNEWLVPDGDRPAERSLVAGVLDAARAAGAGGLVAWFPAATSAFRRFQRDHGFLVGSTPYQMVFRSYRPGVDRAWLADRWFQTLGDADFF